MDEIARFIDEEPESNAQLNYLSYLYSPKAKIGYTSAQTNKFASALGLHYLCLSKKAKIGGTSA